MKKYIVIMLITLMGLSTTSKAQNSSIQWVTFEKEIPLNVNDFINVFNTADEYQSKKCRVHGTNIIYTYNIRPSVARTVFINNLVEMGFNVDQNNVQDFILNHCVIAAWLPGKSAYKTANYFVNSQGNPVASGYTYNGGSGVWALWPKDYPSVPLEKVNCMQTQASQFRIKKEAPQTQYSAPIYVSATPVSNSTYQQPKTTKIEYHNSSSTKAGYTFGMNAAGIQGCANGIANGNVVQSVASLAGGFIFSRTPSSESSTNLVVETTGQENNLNFLAAGLPNNMPQNLVANTNRNSVGNKIFVNDIPTWR